MRKIKKGFTLLELLVVIGIITLLVSVGTASYSTAQKKARDAKRKADLRSISNALEQYYSICGSVYPTTSIYTGGIICASPAITIMTAANVPKDPKSTTATPINYTFASTTSTYTVTANLEADTSATFSVSNQQ